MRPARRLEDIEGIGPAMLEDFRVLGVRSVDQLASEDARELYERLCEIEGRRVDICCYDVFQCAIAQARNPRLDPEKRQWWYWSRLRKAQRANAGAKA